MDTPRACFFMAGKSVIYHPETDILEHEDKSPPETKRVLLYGWDPANLQKVRIKTNESGMIESGSDQYKIIIDETTTEDVIYIGKAPRGTATSATTWEVMKIDSTGATSIFTWADGAWDNRATSLVYT